MGKYHSQFSFTEQKLISPVNCEPVEVRGGDETRPCVLMVGMHLTKTRGGITTLITEILRSPLKEEFDLVYIESQAEDFGKIGKALLALQAFVRFIACCFLRRPQLIYIHLGSNASLYRESIFIFLAKLFGRKILAHFHAGDIDNYYPFQHKLGQKFIQKALSACDLIIAVSGESARQLGRITDSKRVYIIANAINTEDFAADCRPSTNDRTSPSPQSDDPGTIRLLFVGATGKLKGEKDLIKALARLGDSAPGRPKLKVSLLGYGAENLVDYCEKHAVMDKVEFLGPVSMKERIKFFQKSDIFVLPTYAEAMPMSVIEAMAAGLAVITTNVGGIPELVEDGVDGLLFRPGDVVALAEKISFLLDNKEVRTCLGKKAREKARQQMDMRQYTEKLRSQLLSVLSKKL